MDNPKKIIDFIEANNLGYILGNAVRAIIYASAQNLDTWNALKNEAIEGRLQHLKDARAFLNIEIRRLSRRPKK